MTAFGDRDDVLCAEELPLDRIAAAAGTPVYVYSEARLRHNARAFRAGLAAVPRANVAFAIKASPNLGLLSVLADEGLGADVFSGGELARALAAGVPAERIHPATILNVERVRPWLRGGGGWRASVDAYRLTRIA